MPFHYRETLESAHTGMHIPGKMYLHTDGFKEAFQEDNEKALDYFIEALVPDMKSRMTGSIPSDASFFLSVIWGQEEEMRKRADIYFFKGLLNNWQENPEIVPALYAGTFFLGGIGTFGCGDGIIMLGEEEKLRRSSPDLQSFLNSEVPLHAIPWRK